MAYGTYVMYFFVVCGSTSGPFTTESYSKSKHHYTTIEFNDRIIVIVLLNVRLMHMREKNKARNVLVIGVSSVLYLSESFDN